MERQMFCYPNVLAYLAEHCSIGPITTPENDMKTLLAICP